MGILDVKNVSYEVFSTKKVGVAYYIGFSSNCQQEEAVASSMLQLHITGEEHATVHGHVCKRSFGHANPPMFWP
jgi:hypothetical protein